MTGEGLLIGLAWVAIAFMALALRALVAQVTLIKNWVANSIDTGVDVERPRLRVEALEGLVPVDDVAIFFGSGTCRACLDRVSDLEGIGRPPIPLVIVAEGEPLPLPPEGAEVRLVGAGTLKHLGVVATPYGAVVLDGRLRWEGPLNSANAMETFLRSVFDAPLENRLE